MTRKTTTATTQPKMRGKMGHKKRNLCFLFDFQTMTILPFNFVVFTCFCLLQYYERPMQRHT